jgi:hypothetical protein
MRTHTTLKRASIWAGVVMDVSLRRWIPATVFVLLLHCLAISCVAAELKQETVEAFDRYIRATDARVNAELRPGGPFLWVDSLPQPRRQRLYDLLQRGQVEIRQEKTEEEGKPTEVRDVLIHHWTGLVFVPGVSLERALLVSQDCNNHWRTYKPDVRRSKLLEHTDNTFKIYLQFYRDSPRHVSLNTEFEVNYTRIDAAHAISRAVSVRIAELEYPEQPDSPGVSCRPGARLSLASEQLLAVGRTGRRSLHAGGIRCAES